MVRRAFATIGIVVGSTAWAGPGEEAPVAPAAAVAFDDFGADPLDRWRLHNLRGAEVVPEGAPAGTPHSLVELTKSGAKSGWIERQPTIADWRRFDSVRLRVALEAEGPQKMRLVVFGERGSRVRRLTVAPGPWRDVEARLADFRAAPGDVVPGFDDVRRVRLQWDDDGAGLLRLDDMALVPGARGEASSRKTADELSALLFPSEPRRSFPSEHFVLLTDVETLWPKAPQLLARLEEAHEVLAGRYGVHGSVRGDPVTLAVFRDDGGFGRAVARLGEHYGAEVKPPATGGFTVFGVAMAVYDPGQGWDRPVFVREATHALVERLTRIHSNGNWVQAALASAVQARVHPKSLKVDPGGAFRALADGKGPFVPWATLFADARPPAKHHPELLTIVDYLAEQHAPRLPRVWEALARLDGPLHEKGPTAVASVLGMAPADLESEWRTWGFALGD